MDVRAYFSNGGRFRIGLYCGLVLIWQLAVVSPVIAQEFGQVTVRVQKTLWPGKVPHTYVPSAEQNNVTMPWAQNNIYMYSGSDSPELCNFNSSYPMAFDQFGRARAYIALATGTTGYTSTERSEFLALPKLTIDIVATPNHAGGMSIKFGDFATIPCDIYYNNGWLYKGSANVGGVWYIVGIAPPLEPWILSESGGVSSGEPATQPSGPSPGDQAKPIFEALKEVPEKMSDKLREAGNKPTDGLETINYMKLVKSGFASAAAVEFPQKVMTLYTNLEFTDFDFDMSAIGGGVLTFDIHDMLLKSLTFATNLILNPWLNPVASWSRTLIRIFLYCWAVREFVNLIWTMAGAVKPTVRVSGA